MAQEKKGEKDHPRQKNALEWFKEHDIGSDKLSGLIIKESIKIEDFTGHTDEALHGIARDTLKMNSKLQRNKFVRAIRSFEVKNSEMQSAPGTTAMIYSDECEDDRMDEKKESSTRPSVTPASPSASLLDSKILQMPQDQSLLEWLIEEIQSKMPDKTIKGVDLIYRASRDGWTGNDAHSKIDGHGPTFCLMKSEFGHVYGGFTTVPWASQGFYKSDPNAFIFLLKGNEKILKHYGVKAPRAFQLGGTYKDDAVKHCPKHIVAFGRGYEMAASWKCNTLDSAQVAFPLSYQMDSSESSNLRDKSNLLSGHPSENNPHRFKMVEIEFFWLKMI